MNLSIIILWVLVVIISIMVIKLYNLIAQAQKRKSFGESDVGFPTGSTFPLKEILSYNGELINLSNKEYEGTIVLFTTYGCKACKMLYPVLNKSPKKQ